MKTLWERFNTFSDKPVVIKFTIADFIILTLFGLSAFIYGAFIKYDYTIAMYGILYAIANIWGVRKFIKKLERTNKSKSTTPTED